MKIGKTNEKKKSYSGLSFYFFYGTVYKCPLNKQKKIQISPGFPLRDYPTLMEK